MGNQPAVDGNAKISLIRELIEILRHETFDRLGIVLSV
jgi:hypothetical protein